MRGVSAKYSSHSVLPHKKWNDHHSELGNAEEEISMDSEVDNTA